MICGERGRNRTYNLLIKSLFRDGFRLAPFCLFRL